MTDPVYLKLKEDAWVVLSDLWRILFPVGKPVRIVATKARDKRR